MCWNFKIGVSLVILLLRGWSEHFIGQGNPDKIPFLFFYCKKISVWSILLQNGRFYWVYNFRRQFLRNLKEF